MNQYPDFRRSIRLAYRTLMHLQIKQLPVDIVSICRRCKNTLIIPYSKAEPFADILGFDIINEAPSDMAFTYRIEPVKGPVIHLLLYNDEPYQSAVRFRFTLAHELGHIVMKHRNSSYVEEAEANCFAQHLLCPEPLLEALRDPPINEWLLSHAFGVSMSTARIVLQESNRAFHVGVSESEALLRQFQVDVLGSGILLQNVFAQMRSVREM